MVNPSCLRREMVRPICCTITGASPSVGSSSRSSRAPVRRMRPMASICCSPPESFVPWLLRRSRRLGKSSKICCTERPPGATCGGSSRFSSTSRLAKMPRSSGQNAMPRRAMAFDGSLIVCAPLNLIDPSRRPTIPMIDFMVVVLPAPFLPRSVTTSPSPTSKSMPCRMCDSPYQALRPLTSSMTCSEVSLDHLRILGDRGVVALGKDLAALKHGDPVRQRGDDREVVLDHQHGAVRGHALDERGDALNVRMRHPGGRLVEQHHLRVEREGRGGLEGALAPVWKLDRHRLLEVA